MKQQRSIVMSVKFYHKIIYNGISEAIDTHPVRSKGSVVSTGSENIFNLVVIVIAIVTYNHTINGNNYA